MENKRWKIWMLYFDKEGQLVGQGVHPQDYAHRQSAYRRATQLWGKFGEDRTVIWRVAQDNPFIEIVIPILFKTRAEAEKIIEGLDEIIQVYGIAAIMDMYNLAGIPTTYENSKFGWVSTKSFLIERNPHGYILRAPNAHYIT